MSKTDPIILPDVNRLIVERLQSYPAAVAELAVRAVQLSENLPEASVFEALQGLVRDLARKHGGEP